jgi:thiol-disulfide isomerase/thioredoxin
MLFAFVVSAQSKMATYSGTIAGYSGNMGFKTGRLIIDNVVTSLHEMYLIDILPDGKFSVSFPLTRRQECWVSFPFFNSPVYFEPGNNLVQNFNIAVIPRVSSVFKGDGALINNDFNKVRTILWDYNWDAIESDTYQLTPDQYKAYILKIQAHKLALIDSVAKTAGLNKTTYELALRNERYTIANTLMRYNETRESTYRRKHNISFNDRTPVLTPVKLKASYYDFLKNLSYNEPSAMMSYSYYEFMNKLMFMAPVFEKAKAGGTDYAREINILKTKDTSNKDIKATIKFYEDMISQNATAPGALEKARPIVLKSLLNTDISLELDMMYLQSISHNMDAEADTLSDAGLARIKSKIKNKFLSADVVALNNKIKQNIRNAKTQSNYTYNQTPTNAPADSFFVKILEKYKGKVVFIDFWATWCVPCMQSIQQIAPLKEELASSKDLVFLYITNTTSPEKSYLTLMPGIKGEHYRVSNDQYNFLSKLFQINGIPHYAIVNKQGTVVDGNFQWSEISQIKKQLETLVNE